MRKKKMTIPTDRLKQQLDFLYEIDKLKTIFRRTNLISDPQRFENSAEHSWHLAFWRSVTVHGIAAHLLDF
jgi:putative hydrolase of HD superfamily